jgi:hypothetical protein
MDATPSTPFQRVSFEPCDGGSLVASGTPIAIIANGTDLSQNTPTFCVGQNINFQLAALPACTSDSYGNWTLPGNYVNKPWQAQQWVPTSDGESGCWTPVGSVNYRVDDAILQGFTTHCWYLDQPGGTVSFGGRLNFPNGQNVGIAAQGQFIIYRPRIVDFIPPDDPSVNLTDNNGYIELDGLDYEVQVLSQYPGNGDFTQIISRVAGNGSTFIPTITNGCLDSFRFYMNKSFTAGTYHIDVANTPSLWGFQDSPKFELGSEIFGNITYISDKFTDYIMFCPSGIGNIYVTLGTVSWSWSSSTTYTNGNWTEPTQDGIHAPTGNDTSAQLPVWLNVFNP